MTTDNTNEAAKIAGTLSAEFIGKKDGQEAIWSHIHTIEDAWQEAQAELTTLRNRL